MRRNPVRLTKSELSARRTQHQELQRRCQELQERFERGAASQGRWLTLNRWLMCHSSEGVVVLDGTRLAAANRRFYTLCSSADVWRCLSDPQIAPGPLLDQALAAGKQFAQEGSGRPPGDLPARRLLFITGAGEQFVELSIEDAAEESHRTLLLLCDVTEREQLRLLKEENERREQFLALLAHELKNPLAPITTAAELVARLSAEPKVRRAAEIILRQARHQARLIEDLLDAARVREGKVSLRRRRLDLRAALREAALATEGDRRARRITLHLDLPPDPVWAKADPTRLTQLAVNLLANAAKFTPEGGENRLTLESGNDVAWIHVRDTGVGIAAEHLQRIFDPYAQTTTGEGAGLGLGLALVRSLARMHGGGVRAASEGPGRGAEFTVWLPLTPDQETEPAPPPPS